MEMPLKPEQKPTIHSLLSLNDEDLRYNVLKLLLTSGMTLIKHSLYVLNRTYESKFLFSLSFCHSFLVILSDSFLPAILLPIIFYFTISSFFGFALSTLQILFFFYLISSLSFLFFLLFSVYFLIVVVLLGCRLSMSHTSE